MTKEEAINTLIQGKDVDTNKISDGYHSFGELYEHRIRLYITLCRICDDCSHLPLVWRSLKHSDGSSMDGWFVLGLGTHKGDQITYHLPMSFWDECSFADDRILAPEWDGHTSEDVLERIRLLDL
jgi:hypothetical protein